MRHLPKPNFPFVAYTDTGRQYVLIQMSAAQQQINNDSNAMSGMNMDSMRVILKLV